MLEIITGRIASGKTQKIINEIGQRHSQGLSSVLIVPDQVTYNFERRICEQLNLEGFIDIEVCSFNRFVSAILSYCGKQNKFYLDDCSKAMAMRSCIYECKDDLTVFKNSRTRKGFTARCLKMVSTLENCGYSCEDIKAVAKKLKKSVLQDKLFDTALIYGKYLELMANGYTDNADRIKTAQECLPKYEPLKNTKIFIDGFDVFTSRLYGFIFELARYCDITVAVCACKKKSDADAYKIHENTVNDLTKYALKSNTKYKLNGDNELNQSYSVNQRINEISFLRDCFYAVPKITYNEYLESNGAQKITAVPKGIELNSYKTVNDEINGVALKICELIRSDNSIRYKDFAVLCNDVNTYTPIILSVFDRYEIPVFAATKHNITGHPIAMLLFSLLKIAIYGFKPDYVCDYLGSGLILDRDSADFISSFIYKNRLFESEIENGLKHKRDTAENDKRFTDLISGAVEPIKAFRDKVKQCTNAREISTYIYEFLTDNGIYEKIQELAECYNKCDCFVLTDITAQLWNITVKLLDTAQQIIGNREIDIKEYYEMLSEGYENSPTSTIPSTLDSVSFGKLTAAREEAKKYTFIIGVNEGIIPAAFTDDRLVTPQESDELLKYNFELAHTPDTEDARMRFEIYSALCSPNEKLFVSYPEACFSKELMPSMLIEKLQGLFTYDSEGTEIKIPVNSVIIDFVKEAYAHPYTKKQIMLAVFADGKSEEARVLREAINEIDKDKGDVNKNNVTQYLAEAVNVQDSREQVSPDMAKEIFTSNDTVDISRIEAYAGCPFAHFIKYGIKPDDTSEYTTTEFDKGNILHETLKEYINRNVATSQKAVSEEECKKEVTEIFTAKLEEIHNGAMTSTERLSVLNEYVLDSICSVAYEIVNENASPYSFAQTEYEFGAKNDNYYEIQLSNENKKIKVRGKIDRIDKCNINGNTYLRVVDYKTGSKKIALTANDKTSLSIQPLVYLQALIKSEASIDKKNFGENGKRFPGEASYITEMLSNKGKHAEAQKAVTDDGTIDDRGANTLNNMLDETEKIVASVLEEIRIGNTKACPTGEKCKYCKYAAICGYKPNEEDIDYEAMD